MIAAIFMFVIIAIVAVIVVIRLSKDPDDDGLSLACAFSYLILLSIYGALIVGKVMRNNNSKYEKVEEQLYRLK